MFFDVTYACFMMMIRQWLILVYFNGSLVKLQQFLSYVSYDVYRDVAETTFNVLLSHISVVCDGTTRANERPWT